MKIIAYYSGGCYPAGDDPEYFSVSVQYEDMSFEEIFRKTLPKGASLFGKHHDILKAKVILEKYLGEQIDNHLAEKLVVWPGHDLYRLTPSDLDEFLNEHGQIGLF